MVQDCGQQNSINMTADLAIDVGAAGFQQLLRQCGDIENSLSIRGSLLLLIGKASPADFGQAVRRNDVSGAVCGGEFYGTFQFADISRPVVLLQGSKCFRGHVSKRAAGLLCDLPEERERQFGDILGSLSQRRQLDCEDIQPIEEVASEQSGLCLL